MKKKNVIEAGDELVSVDQMEDNNTLRNYNRELLTYKRKVHELSSSLDAGKYSFVSFSDANIAVHKATLEK